MRVQFRDCLENTETSQLKFFVFSVVWWLKRPNDRVKGKSGKCCLVERKTKLKGCFPNISVSEKVWCCQNWFNLSPEADFRSMSFKWKLYETWQDPGTSGLQSEQFALGKTTRAVFFQFFQKVKDFWTSIKFFVGDNTAQFHGSGRTLRAKKLRKVSTKRDERFWVKFLWLLSSKLFSTWPENKLCNNFFSKKKGIVGKLGSIFEADYLKADVCLSWFRKHFECRNIPWKFSDFFKMVPDRRLICVSKVAF